MSSDKQRLLRKIDDLEQELSNLKLELAEEIEREKRVFKVGDKVRILNPKKGQPSRGSILKLHPNSQRATVLTRIYIPDSPDIEVKTVRMYKNLSKE